MPIELGETIDTYLDRAKSRNGIGSDYKLALVMGVSTGAIANYRRGVSLPDDERALKICELSGDDPMILLAEIQALRASGDVARDLWISIVEKLRAAKEANDANRE